ncbi:MAG: DUF5063 domain-containing protein [Candidatus Baltobacteraceae bacterium]
MTNDAVALTHFVEVCEAFTKWIDDCKSSGADLTNLHLLLVELQAALIRLPACDEDADDDDDDVTEEANEATELLKGRTAHQERWKSLTEKLSVLPVQHYQIVFDTLTDGPDVAPVTGWLADDLADIYLDLKKGLAEMNHGRVDDAIWEWRFGYFSHWGRHLTHAQCAILDYLREAAAAFQPT